MRTRAKRAFAAGLFFLAGVLALSSPATAATVTVDLCAKAGTVDMPGAPGPIDIWGYALEPDTGCGDAVAQLPGPTIAANEGDTVIVTLENGLAENVSFTVPGLPIPFDTVGTGGTTSYTFEASRAGTFVYESGVNASIQVPMGLYGALVVHGPAAADATFPLYNRQLHLTNGTPTNSMHTPGGMMTFVNAAPATEKVLVLSEIDPALNADPSGFDLLDYAPKFWLINGRAYPDTADPDAPGTSQPYSGLVEGSPGQQVLIRYANAGLLNHTMTLLGMHQRVVARDAFALTHPYEAVAETIPSGGTADATATIPADALVPAIPGPSTFELCVKAGTVTMPGASGPIDIWGYALKPDGGTCADAVAQLPGPTLKVNQGDTVIVTLENGLAENVSFTVPGLPMPFDTVGTGGTTSYTFEASRAGTFVYESGVNASRQVPMGLYGALIVYGPPSPGDMFPLYNRQLHLTNGTPTTNSMHAPGGMLTFVKVVAPTENVLVLSEIDPALNADPGGFDLLDYAPKYWLINGRAYPDTIAPDAPGTSQPYSSVIVGTAGHLLRYANAGLMNHTMTLLGGHQLLIARDAFPLAHPVDMVAETIASGGTADAILGNLSGSGGASLGPLSTGGSSSGGSATGGSATSGSATSGSASGGSSASGGAASGNTASGTTAGAVPQTSAAPKLLALKGKVQGHRLSVKVRSSCTTCRATLNVKVGGQWRIVPMRLSSNTFVGSLNGLWSGRLVYYVTLVDKSSGQKVASTKRNVRVL